MQRLLPLFVFLAASALGFACELPAEELAEELAEESVELQLDAPAAPDKGEEPDTLELSAPPDLGAGDELPAPALELDLDDNQACVDCHPDAAETWEGSLHQRAWVEPAFQTSYTREPLEFCRTCHAPRADPALEPPPQLAKLGVDCVSCHVRDGAVHTGPAAPATGVGADGVGAELATVTHQVVRSPAFGETACASCHQFEFPRKAHRAPGTLMQKTMLEHERSEWSALDCADCHFPAREDGRGRNHGLAISRDPELLRASLTATVTRLGPQRVRFELAPNGVGHRFPTGDLFRRLELRVEARAADGTLIGIERRYLARHFASELDGHTYIGEARDDRLFGPASIELELDAGELAASAELHWSVSYQRVDSRDHARPERSKLAGEVRLAEGVLAKG